MKFLLPAFLLVFSFAMPIAAPALAQESSSTTVTLYNPLGEEDARVIVGRVIKGVLSVIGSLALLMFMYGGVLWLTSGGNPEMVKKGKEILIWTTLGIVVIFASYAIVNALLFAITTGNVNPDASA